MCERRLSPETPGERRDASEATPVNFEASKRAIAPLSPPVPSYFPANVSSFLASLPSARFSQRRRQICSSHVLFRSTDTRSIRLTCSLCLYRGCRRSHQRSPLSRGDPLATPLSVMYGSRQPRHTVIVPFRHLDWFILRQCERF